MSKAIIDIILNKFVSRKLLVFAICTWALLIDKIDADNWVYVAIVYIGGQSIVDYVKAKKE